MRTSAYSGRGSLLPNREYADEVRRPPEEEGSAHTISVLELTNTEVDGWGERGESRTAWQRKYPL